ncbi:MAG: recombination mediator RecR [Planctomycetota bacterium]|jgi:recombination protein RecR|nr:recombination mediator RecR [Planctomycetota bacterium]
MAGTPLYPPSVVRLVEEFSRLPGIGKRSAERLAFHILSTRSENALALALAIRDAKRNLRACRRCFNIAEGEVCAICQNPGRVQTELCVVELPRDVIAMEKAGVYQGLYHVLQGRLSPASGLGPENLRIGELLQRIQQAQTEGRPVREVIIATRPSSEGDTTAEYLAGVLAPLGVESSRLARGLASGTDFDNAAPSSLVYAFRGRR